MYSTSSTSEVAYEFPPLLRVYRNGHVERLIGTDFVPASTDPGTGVTSKDVWIVPESQVAARVYLPKLRNPAQKLPLVLYFHGGGFCVSSAFNAQYHNYMNAVVGEAKVIAISVNYRKAPEHPLPAAYEDAWAALQWVASHRDGGGPEAWVNEHADFERVFLAGESAGGNIAHNLTMMGGVDVLGMALVHPFFWGSDPIGSEALDPEKKASVDRLWPFVCPSAPNHDDPHVNPVAEGAPSLAGLGCRRVLLCVAEKDVLKDRGRLYYDALSRSGWLGVVEIMEVEGEDHAFHLYNLEAPKAKDFIKDLAHFFNMDPPLVL